MIEIVDVDGEKKIKIGTVKVKLNGKDIVELDQYQGDSLQSIEYKALTLAYYGDHAILEKITDVQTTIDVIMNVKGGSND